LRRISRVKYVTASSTLSDYRRSCFFIPRTGERSSSFPLAAFFCARLAGFFLAIGVSLLPLALGACSGGASIDGDRRSPVLVLGIDGFEWDVLGPLVEAGEMPHFAELMESGQFGTITTIRPTLSPIIWTSMATGKKASKHGIRGFVKKGEEGGGEAGEKRRLYNSNDRRTKAFWNVLSDYGRSAAVVGWWLTFPVEEIEGVMIAQVNTLDRAHKGLEETMRKGSLQEGVEGQVFPAERADEIFEIHSRVVDSLPERVRAIFGEVPAETSPLSERLWANTQWAFRADAAYLEITERLASEGYDLVACYLGGADVTGHRFWRHMRPDLYENPPSRSEIEAFADVIPDYYRFLDKALGRLRAAMPENTNILVITDHGMASANLDAEYSSDDPAKDINSAHHYRARPGVAVVSGPGFSAGSHFGRSWEGEDLPVLASVYDVAPTLLSLLGIPVGEDMTGEVMSAVTLPRSGSIPSHDSEEWRAERSRLRGEQVEENPERMRQLKALGYID
jgi:predicted AlkP superfamily phosphohydrolase/phosphomutase